MKCLAVLACLAVAVASCRTLPPPPPPPTLASPAEILAALRARQEGVKGFQAKARLTAIAPGRSYSGSGVVKALLPASLRVEVVDLFGRSLMSFACHEDRVEVLFPREGKLFTGPATPANLAAFIPPGLTLSQCVKLLAGNVPFSPGGPSAVQEGEGGRGLIMSWDNPNGSPRERLWLAEGGQPQRQEWFGNDGKNPVHTEFADFSGPGGRPKQVKVKTANPEAELRVAFGDLLLNPPLTPADFTLPRPAGVIEAPLSP